MREGVSKKLPVYIFVAFCAYIMSYIGMIVYFKEPMVWLVIPIASFIIVALIMKFYASNLVIQAYAMGILSSLCIFSYGIMRDEFTEVFTVFSVTFCMISCYQVIGVHYAMLILYTFFLFHEFVIQQQWQAFFIPESCFSYVISICSVYLGQFLIISFIRRQSMLQNELEQKAEEAEAAAQAKEDFLANMSHEIRTPMNAITGMVELVLRSDQIPPQERDYLYNIETASEDLIRIIDDILDFTKIDKGDLEIVEERYEITSMVHDIINMIQIMIGEKPVTLEVDLDPQVPVQMKGDGVRIKQVAMKLLSNAAKYTEEGTIKFSITADPIGDGKEKTVLKVRVEDTGIGISKEHMEELFAEFCQGNSARNRSAGGSGLGLAISKNLIELMHGKMYATSEEGKGSVFGFELEQQVINAEPCICISQAETASRMSGNQQSGVKKATERKKPEPTKVTFTAPDVKLLIVDDNKVNLKVAEGLLRPYKMQIETADSGMQAIEMVQTGNYDLVFMDHMMPVMDGVEATKIIRALPNPVFQTMPIVALSANAVRGAKEIFLDAGMNDFIAKPIEMKIMDRVLRKWLPESKVLTYKAEEQRIQQQVSAEKTQESDEMPNWEMKGIDVIVGLEYSDGDEDLYREILSGFMDCIHEKADQIEKAVEDKDIDTYTIEVHSLKSTSKAIGAVDLSELAKFLEQCGKQGDWDNIIEKTPQLLVMYRDLYEAIKPYHIVEENAPDKKEFNQQEVLQMLTELYECMENFDSLQGEELVKQLGLYDYSKDGETYYTKIAKMMDHFDYDGCKEVIEEWRNLLTAVVS